MTPSILRSVIFIVFIRFVSYTIEVSKWMRSAECMSMAAYIKSLVRGECVFDIEIIRHRNAYAY